MHRRTAIGAIAGASLAALTGSGTDSTGERATSADGSPSGNSRSNPGAALEPDDAAPGTDVSFELAPFELTKCGTTCGEATTTITNTGSADATGVRVTVQLSVDDALLWETDEPIGRFEAGAAITRTERVDISFGDLVTIRGNDGQVTVTTIIASDQRTERIVREKTI